MDACDWKFVNSYEVPNGPWMRAGSGPAKRHGIASIKNQRAIVDEMPVMLPLVPPLHS
jgi:hypothetical protein